MSELDDRLKRLETEIDALRRIKTQEDYDEGARLHSEKNAPWVSGPYSHLGPAILNPPYRYHAFPKMVFNDQYEDACRAYDAACLIPARGMDDAERSVAIQLAQRKKDVSSRVVKSQSELDALGSGWFESPGEAVAYAKRLNDEIALAAAHRNYEDRNLSEKAKREIDAVEDAADSFVAEIPEKPKRRKAVEIVGA